jgi:hypothetical protein
MIYLIDPQDCQLDGCKTYCKIVCWVKPLYGVPPCADIL